MIHSVKLRWRRVVAFRFHWSTDHAVAVVVVVLVVTGATALDENDDTNDDEQQTTCTAGNSTDQPHRKCVFFGSRALVVDGLIRIVGGQHGAGVAGAVCCGGR